MNLKKAFYAGREELSNTTENPLLETELIIRKILGVSKEKLYSEEYEIDEEKFWFYLRKRKEHYPLQYIVGEVEFFSRKFFVEEGVFIPRQETETLVEETLKEIKGEETIIDIGTGTGIIAITIALAFPSSRIIATDISYKALKLARKNAEYHGVKNVEFLSGEFLSAIKGRFNMIVSNPPYIKLGEEISSELKYEPSEAYLSPPDGLYHIVKIVKQGKKLIGKEGLILMEISPTISKQVAKLFPGAEIKNDLFGRERVVKLRF